jgi:hypothetical protein
MKTQDMVRELLEVTERFNKTASPQIDRDRILNSDGMRGSVLLDTPASTFAVLAMVVRKQHKYFSGQLSNQASSYRSSNPSNGGEGVDNFKPR